MAIGTCEYGDLGIKPYAQATGSNVSSIEFPVFTGDQSGITMVTGRVVPATDAQRLLFRPLAGTSGYTTRYGQYVAYSTRSTSWFYTNSSAYGLYATRTQLGNGSSEGCAFTMYFKGFTRFDGEMPNYPPDTTGAAYGDMMFWIKSWSEDSNGDYFSDTSGGRFFQMSKDRDTRVRMYFGSGNIASYTYKCHNLMGN